MGDALFGHRCPPYGRAIHRFFVVAVSVFYKRRVAVWYAASGLASQASKETSRASLEPCPQGWYIEIETHLLARHKNDTTSNGKGTMKKKKSGKMRICGRRVGNRVPRG
jgi:hypothetical protein